MEKFISIRSTAVPLPEENVDTDQIIPARFLKATTREGFGDNLFRDWRYDPAGNPRPDFVLNQDRYSGTVLIGGKNFGSGSSREHAAWAIYDFGFRVVISSFFADIFKSNALNNGLLPMQVPEELLQQLLSAVAENPALEIQVELETQLLTVPELNVEFEFEISSFKKSCMINGYDNLDFLLSKKDQIQAYEQTAVRF